MKKLISTAILLSVINIYTIPAFAETKTVLSAGAEQSVQNTKKAKKQTYNKKIVPQKDKYQYINMNWWEGFNDDYLNEYIIKAVENNKDLQMATLTIDEYYQNVIMQRSNEMPMLAAGFLPSYGKFMGKTTGNFGLPIIASYEVDLFGKNHNKTTSVRKLYEASILDEQAAYIAVAAAVGTVYVNIVKLDALIDLQSDINDLRKEIYEIMLISNQEGIVSTSDLVKANKSYVAGIAELVELQKTQTQLLNRLAVLIGDSPENINEYKRADYKQFSFSGNIPDSVPSEIILKRPDYLKAEKMLEKAGIDVRVARKEMLPSINLGGGVFFNNRKFESLLSTKGMLWGLGGGIIQPLFKGWAIKANLKSKKIAYEKSLKNYEKVNLTSMQEVNDTLVASQKDREKLEKERTIQELEQKDFDLSKLKYDEGVIAKLDLNQMQENLLSVNRLVYSTEFDCMIDYISVYKAIAAQNIE